MKVPADMVLTLILPFRPASKASTYIDRFINVNKNMNSWENEEFKYTIMQDHTRVSLSRAALAELMPPPYLSENKINIIVTKCHSTEISCVTKTSTEYYTQESPFQMQCMLERC